MAETAAKTTTPKKKPAAKPAAPDAKAEAKSHFDAAIEEAKAAATALTADAKERAASYREQAKAKSGDWSGEAKVKAGELAKEGKAKASSALSGLGKIVNDNAGAIDEKLGAKYGDYARSASKSLQSTAEKLDSKSVEELGEDARQFVREKPATAVGIAALAGFLIARIFRSK